MNILKLIFIALAVIAQVPVFGDGDAERKPKVAVIGAGLAGLTTAYRLQQKGFDVEVYEARNRVGGRIFSVLIDGKPTELGGYNLLDGGDAKNTSALAEELGLELKSDAISLSGFYVAEGKKIDFNEMLGAKSFDPESLKMRIMELSQHAANMKEVLLGLFSEDDLLYQALAVRIALWEGGPIEQLSPTCFGTLYQQLLGGISVTHPGAETHETLIDLLIVKGGNSRLPQTLAEKLGIRVHLNMPLQSIYGTCAGSYHLQFEGGQSANADILILALPASVYSDICFGGVIPYEKLEAIEKIQYGSTTRLPSPPDPSKKMQIVFDDSLFVVRNAVMNSVYCTGDMSRFDQETVGEVYRRGLALVQEESDVSPVLARDELFASYDRPVAHSWPNDPYVKGSYSYMAAGQEENWTSMEEQEGEVVRTLFAPIGNSLFFAGEHTTILLDGIGTIEAACESGERTARLVEKLHATGR